MQRGLCHFGNHLLRLRHLEEALEHLLDGLSGFEALLELGEHNSGS